MSYCKEKEFDLRSFLRLLKARFKSWLKREVEIISLRHAVSVLGENNKEFHQTTIAMAAENQKLREEIRVLKAARYESLPKKAGLDIDRKYSIRAVNPCSKNTHDETDSVLFLAKDMALPAALWEYRRESARLGANPAHIESIDLLIQRVEEYQAKVDIKVPDTDLPCEIRRCVDGEGVNVQ